MSVIRWQEQNRETLRRLLPEAVVLLPIGATEQHGPHLATGTDALLTETVTERAIRRLPEPTRPLLLAPTIPVGASDHHLPFSGTLSVRVETLLDVLLDIARSVAACGGRRLVFVNGHGGNRGVCSAAAAAASNRHDLAVGYVDYWSLLGDAGDTSDTPVPGHAGEFETSLVMAVDPELVGDRSERPKLPQPPVVEGIELASQRYWTNMQGYTDQPVRANAEQGKVWLDQLAGALAHRLVELAETL
jgi:creatinine amidohydrolase